jgi:FAD/FMN-containing dehydrogenase
MTGVRGGALVERDEDVRLSYATDASGLRMIADAVARPASEDEVREVLRQATSERTPVTTAGGQTSTTGASIADRGVLLSLKRLDGIRDLDLERRTVRAQPGVGVADLRRIAAEHGLLFPPDPTSEEEATVGGAVACNASGARSLRYGATRRWVRSLRVALASGDIVYLHRSRVEKNTAGYAFAQEPVDWFVGSEGTLGVILEVELDLLPLPAQVTGFLIPFTTEADALSFVIAARESAALRARCLEYFDEQALGIARAAHGGNWAPTSTALVYAEEVLDHGETSALDEWLALAEANGAQTDDLLALETDAALAAARRMRHAEPSTMIERGNAHRPAGGRRVSTDWAVPYTRLADAVTAARRIARDAGVGQPVTYGHAGNGHPHQNFIAHDSAELERLERVVEETIRMAVALGGTLAAEHGIGKLKRRWLPLQMNAMQMGLMRAVKRELDPHGILAPGNIF